MWTSEWTGIMDEGRTVVNYYVRPAVSVKKGTKITGGDGYMEAPYTIS